MLIEYTKHSFVKTRRPSLLSLNIRRVEAIIEYGKYHILEGIYAHIGLNIGLLADGNLHNIKLIYGYISYNDHPVKTCILFVGYILEIALTIRVILHII